MEYELNYYEWYNPTRPFSGDLYTSPVVNLKILTILKLANRVLQIENIMAAL